MTEGKNKVKVWRLAGGKAGLMLSEDTAVMSSSDKNFIAVGPNGISISGPINMMTTSENIRKSGVFVDMNDFAKIMPSTIVSPIPPSIPMPPIAVFAYVAMFLPGLLELTE